MATLQEVVDRKLEAMRVEIARKQQEEDERARIEKESERYFLRSLVNYIKNKEGIDLCPSDWKAWKSGDGWDASYIGTPPDTKIETRRSWVPVHDGRAFSMVTYEYDNSVWHATRHGAYMKFDEFADAYMYVMDIRP